MEHKTHRSQEIKKEGDTLALEPRPECRALAFDAEEYLAHMSEFDLSEEQARELLATLWNIMAAFVDLGFGVDSIHRIFPELNGFSGEADADPVESKADQFIEEFERAAHEGAADRKES